MKVVIKPIEAIVWFREKEIPKPIKFRIKNDNNKALKIIKIDKIIEYKEEKLAGNRMYVYRCQSIINNIEKIYELKYNIETCKWYLFKI